MSFQDSCDTLMPQAISPQISHAGGAPRPMKTWLARSETGQSSYFQDNVQAMALRLIPMDHENNNKTPGTMPGVLFRSHTASQYTPIDCASRDQFSRFSYWQPTTSEACLAPGQPAGTANCSWCASAYIRSAARILRSQPSSCASNHANSAESTSNVTTTWGCSGRRTVARGKKSSPSGGISE